MVRIRACSRRKRPLVASGAVAVIMAAATVAVSTPGALAAPSASSSRVPLPVAGSLVPSGAADEGTVPSSQQTSIRVYLAGRDQAGLRALAQAVSTPGSRQYGHFLPPAQYFARFGSTARQVSAVRAWLSGCGMTVTAISQHYIAATGDEAAVTCTTGTSIHAFRWRGRSLRAAAGTPSVPRGVAADVLTITGLSSLTATAQPASVPSARAGTATAACSPYFGANPASTLPPAYGAVQPWQVCGYLPGQLRSAYGVDASGLTGAGTTIAIVDAYASATMASDAEQYVANNGGQPWSSGQYTQQVPTGLPAQPLGWTEEEAMDVEAAHAMAPGANVIYVAAAGTSDTNFLDALSVIVDNHLANIVSGSWVLGADTGIPPATIAAFDQDFLQGAVEGIGFSFASGDTGSQAASDDGNGPQVTAAGYPASDPWVTAVGGTSLAINSAGQSEWETGWETDYASLSADGSSWAGLPGSFADGSGGGPSAVFSKPLYQSLFLGRRFGNHRVVPDVAMDADPVTGMLVGQTFPLPTGSVYVQYASGGTSLATPLFAGLQALAEQDAGHPLGFANPLIYAAAAVGDFHDVSDTPLGQSDPLAAAYTVTSVSSTGTLTQTDTMATFGQAQDAGLAASPRFDDITGVGSPTIGYVTHRFLP